MSDDKVESLSVHRFHQIDNPAAHNPVTALDAAREWIDGLPEDGKPDHIIVLVARNMPEGAAGTRYFQAGSYNFHGMIGLCHEGANMVRASDLESDWEY